MRLLQSGLPLFTSCLEEVFAETELPVHGVLEDLMGIKRAGIVIKGLDPCSPLPYLATFVHLPWFGKGAPLSLV